MNFLNRNAKFLFFMLLLALSQTGLVAFLDAWYNDSLENILGALGTLGFSGTSVLVIKKILESLD
jgi:hypothetical protein